MLRVLAALFAFLAIILLSTAAGGLYLLNHYGRDLPDHSQLANYEPPVASRVYAGDGRLLAE
jgi:penicillin-binding protein 1A